MPEPRPAGLSCFDAAMSTPSAALAGCLLGMAAGDSIGLPFENLPRAAVARLAPRPLEQCLLLGHGLLSDDTEHAQLVLLSLAEARGDVELFRRRLAMHLRCWMLAIPPGVGGATARSLIKLLIGFPPHLSGVRSAGNGPAMRAPMIGVALANDPQRLRDCVAASTAITHRDPRAFEAALAVAVAVAAACAARHGPLAPAAAFARFRAAYVALAQDLTPLDEVLAAIERALRDDLDLDAFAAAIGCGRGVSGYALHTVPLVLYAWLRHGHDFRAAVTATVHCGGDTDSTAAIVGGIVGAGLGAAAIPASWLTRIVEWPRGVAWMRERTDDSDAAKAPPSVPSLSIATLAEIAWIPWRCARNPTMLAIILLVWVRRTAMRAITAVTHP